MSPTSAEAIPASIRAEEYIRHLAWIGRHDDPMKVASEAAGIMRALLDEFAGQSSGAKEGSNT